MVASPSPDDLAPSPAAPAPPPPETPPVQPTAVRMVDHLLQSANGGGGVRLLRRSAVHQAISLIGYLEVPDAKADALRRLRDLLRRSVFNLWTCTVGGLRTTSVLLGWLTPPPGSAEVLDEVLALLATLGSHAATSDEVCTLLGLARQSIERGGAAALPRPQQLLDLLVAWCGGGGGEGEGGGGDGEGGEGGAGDASSPARMLI